MNDALTAAAFQLPPALISKVDLSRLVREVETLDGGLEAQKVRGGGNGQYTLPVLSGALNDFVELNKLDLTNDQSRMILKEQLRTLKDSAPVVHMTFATEADLASLGTLVAWLRANAHPQTLLSVGLQPSLIGGVYLRTPNHVHDLSLRSLFNSKSDIIVSDLEEFGRAAG